LTYHNAPRQALLMAAISMLSVPAFGGTGPEAMTLNGSAQLVTAGKQTVLVLTKAVGSTAGTAFTTEMVPFGPLFRFTTFFQFQMTNPGGICAADGMTFTIQAESPTALGGDGGGLGYTTIVPSMAVEFDTCDIGAVYENRKGCIGSA
jgi:hypothetical protein